MKQYPVLKERIFLGDLEPETLSRRRKVCASKKQKYGWMRFDTCTEIPAKSKEVQAITGSRDVSRFLHESIPFAGRGREFFMILCLDNKNTPIAVAAPQIGGRSSAEVDPSIVLQAVLLSGATSFIVAHNHPSGDPTPSSADMEFTRLLKRGCETVKVNLFDHVVLTDDPTKYTSFLDRGMMNK